MSRFVWLLLPCCLSATLCCRAPSAVRPSGPEKPAAPPGDAVQALAPAGIATVDGYAYRMDGQGGDLYLQGKFLIQDEHGRRWLCDVTIVPGAQPILSGAGAAWRRSCRRMGTYAGKGIWLYMADDVCEGLGFVKRCLWDYGLAGIGRDYGDTTRSLGRECSEFSVGWLWRIPGRFLWGYLLKPAGRLVTAPVGAAGGLAYAALVPVYRLLSPAVVSLVDAGLLGTAWPAALFILHNGAWTASVFSTDPDPLEPFKYWAMGFTAVIDPPAGNESMMVTQAMLENWVGRYIKERQLFVRFESFRKQVKKLRVQAETAEEALSDIRRRQLEAAYNKAAGISMVLTAEARDCLENDLAQRFARDWKVFLATLSSTEKKWLENEFDALDAEANWALFLRHIQPYLEPGRENDVSGKSQGSPSGPDKDKRHE